MKRGFLLRLTPSLHSSAHFGASSALHFARFVARSASGTLRRRRILGSSLGFAHIGGATSQAGGPLGAIETPKTEKKKWELQIEDFRRKRPGREMVAKDAAKSEGFARKEAAEEWPWKMCALREPMRLTFVE